VRRNDSHGTDVEWEHARVGAETTRSPGRLVVITGLPGSGKTTSATELAATLPACRMCPDDWMMASGIDLWDQAARARIESFQLALTLDLLRAGGSKPPEELARMVGLDLTDPSIWAGGIEALSDDLDEAEALATELGLG